MQHMRGMLGLRDIEGIIHSESEIHMHLHPLKPDI